MTEAEYSHFSLPLLIDASSPRVQVGIPSPDGWRSLHSSREPALTSIFTGLRRCIEETGQQAAAVDALLFCEGPGSTLGLRAAATLTKTLSSQVSPPPALYTYNALHAAHALSPRSSAPIMTDYRHGQWYLREKSGNIRVIDEPEAMETAPSCRVLRQRKSWSNFSSTGPEIDYDLSQLAGFKDFASLLLAVDSPALFDLRPTSFKKWKPTKG